MKKFSNLFTLLLFSVMSFAQITVNVSGTVSDVSGNGVDDITVYITVDSTNNNFVYYNSVQTAADGTYSDSFEVPDNMTQGAVYISIWDCNNANQGQMTYWSPGGDPVVNFLYCNVDCSVQIDGDNQGNLTATPEGTAPFAYEWNTAETTASISVTQGGTYCLTLTDNNNCQSSTCYTYQGSGGNDTLCWVTIQADSINIPGVSLTANANGTAPFSYSWNTGETTAGITVNEQIEYCVTVVDANGCEAYACIDFSYDYCSVTVLIGNASIFADAYGTAPYTYEWNTGETTQSFVPMANGTYCVTVTDANGCESTDCAYYQINGGNDSLCTVTIYADTVNVNGWGLTAVSDGIAPFTYLWSTNETTASIITNGEEIYCVTVVDANGCEAYACMDLTSNNCSVYIYPGNASIFAQAYGTAPFTYTWSTGETTFGILPITNGTYCVTITDANGCSSSDCMYYDVYTGGDSCTVEINVVQNGTWLQANPTGTAPFFYSWGTGETSQSIAMNENIMYCVNVVDADSCVAVACYDNTLPNISGFVFADSLSFEYTGLVDLYSLENNVATWVASTTFSAANYIGHYSFEDVPFGNYIVQATIDPNTPAAGEYIPTYHNSAEFWDDADVISLPDNQNTFYNIVLISVDDFVDDGSGVISGGVFGEDGFTGEHDDEERNNDPIPGVEILLHNSSDQPIAYAFTGADGSFTFGNLPYGTYTVYIEIPGMEQASYTITIGPDDEIFSNVIFTVGETITTSIRETLLEDQLVLLYPNPVKNTLNVEMRLADAKIIGYQVVNLTGQVVMNQLIDTNQLNLSSLTTGVYILKIQTTNGVIAQQFVKE
jgi:hypothetical protein